MENKTNEEKEEFAEEQNLAELEKNFYKYEIDC